MFSQTSEYALRALTELARHPQDQYVLVGILAENANLPHHYLSKILQNLVRMDILQSRKGSRGGFRLANPADSITLFDVVNAIENLNQTRRCLLGLSECTNDNPCHLHYFWAEQSDRYREMLRTTTIGDLMRSKGGMPYPPRPLTR